MNDPASLPIALLDANVLYSARLRDLILSFASASLFLPKWSEKIQMEWSSNLMKKRDSSYEKRIKATIRRMDAVFPNASIANFEGLESKLELPDTNDRHVLAAAICSKAEYIVTFNLKDFPVDYLKDFSIKPIHPDDFASQLISQIEKAAKSIFSEQIKRLRKPPLLRVEVLQNLKNLGLEKTAKLLTDNHRLKE